MDSDSWEDVDSDMETVYMTCSEELLKRRYDDTKEPDNLCKVFDMDIKHDPNKSTEEQHEKIIGQFMSKLYQEECLCDVILKIGNYQLPAHKIVLSAHSPKLFKLFVEKYEGKDAELSLDQTTPEAVTATLCYLYTHKIVISEDSVDNLLSASKELGFQEIINLCEQFLFKDRTMSVFERVSVAHRHKLDDVTRILNQNLNENFLETVYLNYSTEFLQCSFSRLYELLSRDEIHVISEIDVFYAALAWLDAKKLERTTYACDIMKCVRFILMSPEEIATHVETTHVFKIPEVKEMVFEAMRYHALLSTGSPLASVANAPRKRQLIPASKKNIQIRNNSIIFGSLRKQAANKDDTTRKNDKRGSSEYYDIP